MLGAATQTSFEAAHREDLRPPPLSSGADPPPHPAPHRTARDREHPAAGTSQVGRRAHAGVVRPVPSPRRQLRATGRHPPRLVHAGRSRHRLALHRAMVLIGALSRPDLPPNRVAVVAFVRQRDSAGLQAFEHQRASPAIGSLPTGERENELSAKAVGQRIDLDCTPAPRATPDLALLPPWLPRRNGVPSRRWSRSAPERAACRLGRRFRNVRPSSLGRRALEEIGEGRFRPVEIARRVRPTPCRLQYVLVSRRSSKG